MFVPNCMSPEIINQNSTMTYKSDIWSLGMILIEMITLDIPYNECSSYEEIINNVFY
jgi:serine/threonine protein kinase